MSIPQGVRKTYPLDLVTQYGAKADASSRFTGAVTAASATLNDPSNTFNAGHVGQYVTIEGGGAANNAGNFSIGAQITALIDTHNVTLSRTAATSGSALTYKIYKTDNAPMIAAGFAALPGSTHGGRCVLAPNSLAYAIESPVILNNLQYLEGFGAWGATLLRAGAQFPRCTTTGFTSPASSATAFTITVDAVPTWMQLPNALISNSVGVGVTGGIEFTYTGTTGTTFTGCKTRFTSTTVASGTPLSTFMVWIDQPGTTLGGFSQGIRYIALDTGGLPGIAGVYMPHAQETSGLRDVSIRYPDNFGVRIAREPANTGQSALDYTFDEVSVIMAPSCDTHSIGIDIHCTQRRGMRGIGRMSVVSTGVTLGAKAGIRMNGMGGGQHGPFHIESFADGVLVGDIAQTGPISIRGIERGAVQGTTNLVRIGNTAGNIVRFEDLTITSPALFSPATNLVQDDLNGNTCTENNLGLYAVDANGKVHTDSLTGTANLVQPTVTGVDAAMVIPVAAADRSAAVKAAALAAGGYVCDGTDDHVEIQAAIDALAAITKPSLVKYASGIVQLVGQKFVTSTDILGKSGIKLRGLGSSNTVIIPSLTWSGTNIVKLANVNVEQFSLEAVALDGRKADGITTNGWNFDNTGAVFIVGPDAKHLVQDVIAHDCSGTGGTMGVNCRGAKIINTDYYSCGQHGFYLSATDCKVSVLRTSSCGTDDGAMAYYGIAVMGSNNQLLDFKANFQRGHNVYVNTSVNYLQGQSQDAWGAGFYFSNNSDNNVCDIIADSNAMQPQGGVTGSDANIYDNGTRNMIRGVSRDRGFAESQVDISGNVGNRTAYGVRYGSGAGKMVTDLVVKNMRKDSIVGTRTGLSARVMVTDDAAVSDVQVITLKNATGGTFTITDVTSGQTTGAITFSATAATLQANAQTALQALGTFTTNVTTNSASFAYQFKVVLGGALANTARATYTVNGASLTGTSVNVQVNHAIEGGTRTSEARIANATIVTT